MPWLAQIAANAPGARLAVVPFLRSLVTFRPPEELPPTFEALSQQYLRHPLTLLLYKWLANSIAGGVWNIVYFSGSTLLAGTHDPGAMTTYLSAASRGDLGPGPLCWCCVISLVVAGSVLVCNIVCPPLIVFAEPVPLTMDEMMAPPSRDADQPESTPPVSEIGVPKISVSTS
jgi:hypothetical protein